MTFHESCNIIKAFKIELECAVEHDLYTTLDTGSSEELLEALTNVNFIPRASQKCQ